MVERRVQHILFLLATSVAASPGIGIWNDPAPPPESGPPLSAHATRDKSKLPAEICSIVGAYLGTVLIIGVCLLTFGRRMRLAAMGKPKPLDIEMVKAGPHGFEPTPVEEPKSARSWFSRANFGRSKTSLHSNQPTSPISPGGESVASFDQTVIDADRERRQQEMERLYAAVMEHDAKQANVVYEENEDRPATSGSQPATSPRMPENNKRPPRLLTKWPRDFRSSISSSQASPASPRSPIRAIYPPETFPSARQNSKQQNAIPVSPRSMLSRVSYGSSSSKQSRGIRNLQISAPMQKYPGDSDDEARTPLSPRFYSPGAPPSPPAPSEAPTSPGTFDGNYADESMDQPRPLPMPMAYPQRGSHHASNAAALSHPAAGAKSAGSSTSTLPLRMLDESTGSPAPVTRTTYLDRRRDQLGLTSPRTGVPMTPYSPYMPFTPITPVTPHLVSRKEMKKMKKNMGRRVATEDELVKDSKDMWDSGY